MSIAYLKIKIKSLADEARTIRIDERKHLAHGRAQPQRDIHSEPYRTFFGLQTHRLNLRPEIRAALIAYGYLRGRAYRQIEPCTRHDREPYDRPGPNWDRVADLVVKYGPAPEAGGPPAIVKERKQAIATNLKAWRDVKADAPPARPASAASGTSGDRSPDHLAPGTS